MCMIVGFMWFLFNWVIGSHCWGILGLLAGAGKSGFYRKSDAPPGLMYYQAIANIHKFFFCGWLGWEF